MKGDGGATESGVAAHSEEEGDTQDVWNHQAVRRATRTIPPRLAAAGAASDIHASPSASMKSRERLETY